MREEGRKLSKIQCRNPNAEYRMLHCGDYWYTLNGQWSLSRESLCYFDPEQKDYCGASSSFQTDILLFAVLLLLVIPPLLCFCSSFLSAYSDLPLLSFISLCLRILKPKWYLPSEYLSFYCCMDCFGFDVAQD